MRESDGSIQEISKGKKILYDRPLVPLPSHDTIRTGDLISGLGEGLKCVSSVFRDYFNYVSCDGNSATHISYDIGGSVLFMRHTRHNTLEVVAATSSVQSQYTRLNRVGTVD
ncbi:MAG: hypothetical protein RL557_944 [archaeon]|jgi:hypothetical protein